MTVQAPSAPSAASARRSWRLRRADQDADDVLQQRIERVLLALFCLVPVTFFAGTVGGFQFTGWAWFAGVTISAPLALLTPVSRATMRHLSPYLLFLTLAVLSLAWSPSLLRGVPTFLQLLAPVPAFLLAADLRRPTALLGRAGRVAAVGIVLAAVLSAANYAGILPSALALSPRPMAIALVVLLATASVTATRSWGAVLGALALFSTGVTGSRTATAVLLVVLVLSPSWRVSWRGRAVLALLALLAVLGVSRTEAFQERFFFGSSGTLSDALRGGESLNTAGRRELWPRLYTECTRSPIVGHGVGAGSDYTGTYTYGSLFEPHNEYLRLYCDVGLAGSVPFWGAVLLGGAAGVRLGLRRDPVGAAIGQVVLALLLLSITDNPIIYTAHFMIPAAVLLGCGSRLLQQQGTPV